MSVAHQKVDASHLSRDAYLYVRQSTPRQVFEHGESRRRQYALRERAVALGWPTERIVVIDSDQGLSGADRDREGFKNLVAEVSMGRAGIVLGLEVSRSCHQSSLPCCGRWRSASLAPCPFCRPDISVSFCPSGMKAAAITSARASPNTE